MIEFPTNVEDEEATSGEGAEAASYSHLLTRPLS